MELLLCFVISFGIIIFVLSIKEISYKKIFSKYNLDFIIIIPLYSCDFSEIYLKSKIELIKNSNVDVHKVILLNKGLTSEQYDICQNIVKNNNMFQIITLDEISDSVIESLK